MKKWKAVFWILFVLFLLKIISIPLSGGAEFIDALILIYQGISLIPIYGYSYQIAIGSKTISIVIFSINFILIALSYIFFIYDLNVEYDALFYSITLFSIFLSYIYLLPQYRYAFKSDEIWRKNA